MLSIKHKARSNFFFVEIFVCVFDTAFKVVNFFLRCLPKENYWPSIAVNKKDLRRLLLITDKKPLKNFEKCSNELSEA